MSFPSSLKQGLQLESSLLLPPIIMWPSSYTWLQLLKSLKRSKHQNKVNILESNFSDFQLVSYGAVVGSVIKLPSAFLGFKYFCCCSFGWPASTVLLQMMSPAGAFYLEAYFRIRTRRFNITHVLLNLEVENLWNHCSKIILCVLSITISPLCAALFFLRW